MFVYLIKCSKKKPNTLAKSQDKGNNYYLQLEERHCEIAKNFIHLPPHRAQFPIQMEWMSIRLSEDRKEKYTKFKIRKQERITPSQIETNM